MPPPSAAESKGLKHFFKQLDSQQKAKQARQEKRANRVQSGLENGQDAFISNEKFDAYAMNEEHPRGGDKAERIANKTGLALNRHYDPENTQLAFDSATRSPGYWVSREHVKQQIRADLAKPVPAELKGSTAHGDRVDTKHKISGPKGQVTMRAQWYYKVDEHTGEKSKVPSLVTFQPSNPSSDEEGEKK